MTISCHSHWPLLPLCLMFTVSFLVNEWTGSISSCLLVLSSFRRRLFLILNFHFTLPSGAFQPNALHHHSLRAVVMCRSETFLSFWSVGDAHHHHLWSFLIAALNATKLYIFFEKAFFDSDYFTSDGRSGLTSCTIFLGPSACLSHWPSSF